MPREDQTINYDASLKKLERKNLEDDVFFAFGIKRLHFSKCIVYLNTEGGLLVINYPTVLTLTRT